jgi:hypothetical protein
MQLPAPDHRRTMVGKPATYPHLCSTALRRGRLGVCTNVKVQNPKCLADFARGKIEEATPETGNPLEG